MKRVPSIQKALPSSPSQVQTFSSTPEAVVATMAQLNRLSTYIGNGITSQIIDSLETTTAITGTPCGFVQFDNVALNTGDQANFDIVFDEARYNDPSTNVYEQPFFGTLTLVSTAPVTLSFKNNLAANGQITISVYSHVDNVDFVSFFYQIIPLLP